MTILTTLGCVVTDAGISKPAYSDLLQTLNENFRAIYGYDAYLDPDSQDGQWLAVLAKGFDDANDVAVAVYNSFSPATAQGRALSNNVKINGIARAIATKSTVPLRLTGQVGTTITGGVAADAAGNRWLVPDSTVIPSAGFVDVTGTAEVEGAVQAASGTITSISTPTLGWQAVTNTGPAVAGAPVETDALLRKRQAISVSLPSQTVLDGIQGAVAAVAGVTQVRAYDNDTNVTDANGVPAHSVAVVTVGGANTDIATAIMLKKGPGCGTYGTTSVPRTTPGGTPVTINYFAATSKRIVVAITVKALTGYLSSMGTELKQAIADYINALGIGRKVDLGKVYLPAQLFGQGDSKYYEVDALALAISPAAPAAADVAIAFNEVATCAVADITLTVT